MVAGPMTDDRDRQTSLFECGLDDPGQAAIDEFDAEDASGGDSSERNPQGDGPETGSPDDETDRPDDDDPFAVPHRPERQPVRSTDSDDAPRYRSDRPRVRINPDTGEELTPCPWCYSDYLVDGNRGVACGDCSASIPTHTEWYQRGDVVRIDF